MAQGIAQKLRSSSNTGLISDYQADPTRFVLECCNTLDEADPSAKRKLVPDKPHIRLIIQRLLIDRVTPLLFPKSRRMILSWSLTACETAQAFLNEHSGVYVQSQKFDAAAELVNRHWFILENLPADKFPVQSHTEEGISWECGLSVKRYKGGRGGTARLEFSNGSYIQAVAEGKDQLRQYGASMVRQEEIAFWGRQEESYDAAIECLQASATAARGGQLVCVTTANPSWFGDFLHDRDAEDRKGKGQAKKLSITRPIEGVREWETTVGAHVVEIHYTADPDKRSAEWKLRAKKGKRERGWDREMEIKWDVYTGMPVFGDCFNADLHISKVPLEWQGEGTVLRGWDYGNTPCCTLHWIDNLNRWCITGEICTDTRPLGSKDAPPTSNIGALADQVNTYCALTFPGADYIDIDDPAGSAKSATDSRSCRDVLNGKGIYPQSGVISDKARIESMAEWLSKLMRGGAAVQIDEGKCPMVTEGLKGGYRYAELGDTGKYSDKPEKNQYSHPLDTVCYVASKLNMLLGSPVADDDDDYEDDVPTNRASRYY